MSFQLVFMHIVSNKQ